MRIPSLAGPPFRSSSASRYDPCVLCRARERLSFQYAILLVGVISTGIKYILHSIEIRTGEQWENKGVFMLYADLVLGFARLTLYMLFIIVMMKIHTFPLFAIRPMFIAMRYAAHLSERDR
jgi:E3 ubiquitin-protein ligase synoviolin